MCIRDSSQGHAASTVATALMVPTVETALTFQTLERKAGVGRPDETSGSERPVAWTAGAWTAAARTAGIRRVRPRAGSHQIPGWIPWHLMRTWRAVVGSPHC